MAFISRLRSSKNSVFSAFAGLLAGLIIPAIIGSVLPLREEVIIASMFLFIILAVFVIGDDKNGIDRIHQEITSKLNQQLITESYTISNAPDGDKDFYDAVERTIRSAHRRLLIVGLYRPNDLYSSKYRDRYYDAIERLLQDKLAENSDFDYKRIVQVKNIHDECLHTEQTDKTTLEHCRRMLAMHKPRTTLSIRLRTSLDVLGSLSFLVIDNAVIIALPSIEKKAPKVLQANQLKMAVIVQDAQGILADRFAELFQKLDDESTAIESVE